ncbi:MAG: helix-turn-helix domain-containing protein [Polyangiales bacterium]
MNDLLANVSVPNSAPVFPTDGVPDSAPSSVVTMGSVGARLSRERTRRGFTLEEVSRGTRIPLTSLQRLEADRFDDLPGEVFVRGFIKSYARFVGLEVDAVLAHYGTLRRVPDVSPIALPAPVARREVRQVGVAVAVMVLVVLCTMALSFVLKPRGRDVPVEVSTVCSRTLPLV